MIDITNEILTKIKNDIPTAKVVTSTQSNVTTFPRIVIRELSNRGDINSIDSSGEYASIIAFDINIYTKGNKRVSKSKEMQQVVDSIMNGYYGFNRLFSEPLDNYLDKTIHRHTFRYEALVDKNKMIYRR